MLEGTNHLAASKSVLLSSSAFKLYVNPPAAASTIKTNKMQQLQLSIPQPCHENWNNMTPEGQGRFCGSCAKQVIDFSSMTDTQLMLYFANLQTENICGRVHPDQLNRTISQPVATRKKILVYWQYMLAFIMFFFAKSQQTKAQGGIPKTEQQPSLKKPPIQDTQTMLGGLSRWPVKEIKPSVITQLFIADEALNPIPFATAFFLPSGKTVAADSTGALDISRASNADSIRITAIGYEEKTVAIKSLNSNSIILNRQIKEIGEVIVQSYGTTTCRMILGSISSVSVYKINAVKDTIQNIRSIFIHDISVYPNPVQKQGTLSILLKLQKTGIVKLSVTNAAGQLMLIKNLVVSGKQETVKTEIPKSWSSGIYFVRLTDEKHKLIATQKFIVE